MSDQTYAGFAQQAKAFHDKCDQQYRVIMDRIEAKQKEAAERKERKQQIAKKFEDTILAHLEEAFVKISNICNSPYLQLFLDTHVKRSKFIISQNAFIPGYAFFAISSRSGEQDDEVFPNARYLLFTTSIDSETSFSIFLQNDERESMSVGANEDDSSRLLATYSFDNYNKNEIEQLINKYLLEEINYYNENSKLHVEEEDNDEGEICFYRLYMY